MKKNIYVLIKNGDTEIKGRGSYNDCLLVLHRKQNKSSKVALENGWSIIPFNGKIN